ncbi:MAG: hypothetical protein MI924_12025 [Chloroflexales bacterium]|nr:hypothetical protein [Chloroflexales bacterium]
MATQVASSNGRPWQRAITIAGVGTSQKRTAGTSPTRMVAPFSGSTVVIGYLFLSSVSAIEQRDRHVGEPVDLFDPPGVTRLGSAEGHGLRLPCGHGRVPDGQDGAGVRAPRPQHRIEGDADRLRGGRRHDDEIGLPQEQADAEEVRGHGGVVPTPGDAGVMRGGGHGRPPPWRGRKPSGARRSPAGLLLPTGGWNGIATGQPPVTTA